MGEMFLHESALQEANEEHVVLTNKRSSRRSTDTRGGKRRPTLNAGLMKPCLKIMCWAVSSSSGAVRATAFQ